jgi:hypothetical protein
MDDYIALVVKNLKQIRTSLEREIKPGRERTFALIKIEVAELWLSKCESTELQ